MGDAPTLFTKDDTTGDYVEYTPPEPPAFHDTLPEEIKGNEHLKDVENAQQLATYYVDLKSNYLRPPDSPDGYEFTSPDGYNLDEEAFKVFKQSAFENGINQKQFDAIMKADVERHQSAMQAFEASIEFNRAEAEKALKTEWGNNYEKNLESAKMVLNHEKLADSGFKKFLEETRFGDNPEVIKFFARLSNAISEDTFHKPGTGGTNDSGVRLGEDGRPMLRFPSMENK